MTVVGSKAERPIWSVAGQVDVFDQVDLEWLQLQDFADVSRYVPALETDFKSGRFGATGLSIRGIGGNRVALERDGVPLPQQFDVGGFADSGRLALDPAITKRVEVLHGPASVLYGSDAIAGVVVITSVDGKDLVADNQGQYIGGKAGYYGVNNSLSTGLTYAWAKDRDSLVLTVNRQKGHGMDNKAINVANDRIHFTQQQFFTKWTHEFEQGGSLRTSVDYFKNTVESDIRAPLGFDRFATTTQLLGDDEQKRETLTAEYIFPKTDWINYASLMVYSQKSQTEQFTDQSRSSGGVPVFLERNFFISENSEGSEFRAHHYYDMNTMSHRLVAGVEWERQKLIELRDAVQTDLVSGISTKTVLGETFPLRDLPQSTSNQLAFFIQDEIQLDEITLIPAMRWDQFELKAETDSIFTDGSDLTDLADDDLTFRFGVIWQLTDYLSLYGHYAEGFRAPPAEDINLFLDIPLFNIRAIPNPDLKAERSNSKELSIRLKKGGTALQAGVYYSSYDNFIESRTQIGVEPVTGVVLFQSRNIAKATVYGGEIYFDQSLGELFALMQDWHLNLGLHSAHGDNDVTNAPLNTINPLKMVLGLRWEPASFSVTTDFRITHYGRQSRVDFSDGNFFVPESATVFDFVVRWEQSQHLQWYLGLYNLSDKRYWRYADVRNFEVNDPRIEVISQPGFNAALTLHINF